MPEGTAPAPRATSAPAGPGMSSGPPTMLLPPSKGKWIQQEAQSTQKSMMMDIAMLLHHETGTGLAEAFCSYDSLMTKVAQLAGMTTDRWALNNYDLSTESGYMEAGRRLRELRPRRLWLSSECGPFSQMQNTNQRTPEQVAILIEKRKGGFKQWSSCIRLAWVQLELGGYF